MLLWLYTPRSFLILIRACPNLILTIGLHYHQKGLNTYRGHLHPYRNYIIFFI
jgi:hypothetical protein